jgi:hypothetical protein
MIVGTLIVVHNSVPVNTFGKKGGRFLNLSKYSDFGLEVKTELLKRGKEQKWLVEELKTKTGLYVDNGYIYKILTGQRNAPKIVSAIRDILRIKD